MNQISQAESRPSTQQTFFARTMGYFALALAAAAGGVSTGIFLLPPNLLASRGFMFAMFAATLILVFTSRKWSIGRFGYLFLILFAGVLGITMVPLLAFAALTAGTTVLAKALLAAVSMFVGMAIFGFTTRKDLSGIGGFLMASLIGMIVVSLITLILHFFGISVWSNGIELIFSGFGILIFAGFVAYDFQKIKNRSDTISPIQASISLFLDFILLFQYILRFMTALSRD
ncbi:MAG: Bax inhibitor-1/YccA family protein [Candidatus Peribacteraceae bacterium]|nr:Bax inhibitor-1/YccA family protein [Candidatus Peribacteraceae bacterium]